jgi:hypothetical protein
MNEKILELEVVRTPNDLFSFQIQYKDEGVEKWRPLFGLRPNIDYNTLQRSLYEDLVTKRDFSLSYKHLMEPITFYTAQAALDYILSFKTRQQVLVQIAKNRAKAEKLFMKHLRVVNNKYKNDKTILMDRINLI